MKIATFFSFLLMGLSVLAGPQSTDFSQKSKPATMKVLIHRQIPEVILEVKGRHHVYNPLDGTQLSWGMMARRFPVVIEQYGLKWGDKFPGCHQIRVVPGDSQSSILVNGIQYKGCIEIYNTDGKFNVINEVGVEDYLKSTLSLQFPQPLHEEVLSAIAIVARTNAYYLAQKNKQSFWHVSAEDVAYEGLAITPRHHIAKAVENTRQAILNFNDGPFAATWTENSAGRTADFAAVFRKAISTPSGVATPVAAKDRQSHKWTCSLDKNLLAQETDLGHVHGVDLYVAHNTDKVYAVKVTGETQVKDFDFFTFQKIVGAQKLRSNDFKVEVKGDQLVFTGYGDGPGVGLCLYSAKAMAEKGEKADQILQAFFPNTRLEKVKF